MTTEEVALVRSTLMEGTLGDGRRTAGWHARQVKNNKQMQPGDHTARASTLIHDALKRNKAFQAGILPRAPCPVPHAPRPMPFSRYEPSMSYGTTFDLVPKSHANLPRMWAET